MFQVWGTQYLGVCVPSVKLKYLVDQLQSSKIKVGKGQKFHTGLSNAQSAEDVPIWQFNMAVAPNWSAGAYSLRS